MTHPKLEIKKVIKADRKSVFEAWTNPELMQKWFYPGSWSAKVTNTLKVGGRYSVTMVSDGSENPCNSESGNYIHSGEYIEIVPPERLVFTWNSHLIKDSKVTITLRELDGSTELTLVHELLGTEEICAQHNQGWNGCVENLQKFLS